MLIDNLLPVGAVGFVLAMLMTLIYYTLVLERVQPADANPQTLNHHPLLDDDMVYFASSMYPYYEYAHFPALLNHHALVDDDMVHLASSMHPSHEHEYEYVHFPALPLSFERQEITQPI